MEMMDLKDIIKNIGVSDSPVRNEPEVPVTREQLDQQAKEGAEQEAKEAAQKAYDAAREADPARLEAALRAIRDYEWEVKSGQVDAELGLDVLLARL